MTTSTLYKPFESELHSHAGRPAYIEDRIALETKRREHRREAPKGCRCPFCLDRAGFAQLVKAALARNQPDGDEVTF